MAKKEKQQKKKKGRSVQDMMGIQTFTKYGLLTDKGELLFYLVSPTNISVLSYVNIEIKIRHAWYPHRGEAGGEAECMRGHGTIDPGS